MGDIRLISVPTRTYGGQNSQTGAECALVSRFGLAGAEQNAHQQCQIAGGSLEQQLLVRIAWTSDIQPVHTAGIELMRALGQ